MRRAFLEEADQEEIASAVREVVEGLGARVTEHTRSHTAFSDLEDADAGWSKGGYVGTYRHVGESEVELRYDVHASFPQRLFWTTVGIELLVVLGLFLFRPSAAVWVGLSILLWALFVGSFLLYLHTWRSAGRLEEDLLDVTVDAIRDRGAGAVVTPEERELQELEDEAKAEALARRLAERREPDPGFLTRAKRRVAEAVGDDEEDEEAAKRERVRELRQRLEDRGGPDDEGS